jgi:hypothetical protein
MDNINTKLAPFGYISIYVVGDPEIPPTVKALYSLLCCYCGEEERHCSPLISILAEQLVTSEDAVLNALEFLERKGIIERRHTEPGAATDINLLDDLYEEQCIVKGLFMESEIPTPPGETIRITDSVNWARLLPR